MTSDVTKQNFVNELTDTLLAGGDTKQVRKKYDLPPSESDDLIDMIEQLHSTMQPVKPSKQFSYQLKAELMNTEPRNVVVRRIRKLPARVQYAAVAAIVGGFLMILQRLFFGEESAVSEETNPVQEKY